MAKKKSFSSSARKQSGPQKQGARSGGSGPAGKAKGGKKGAGRPGKASVPAKSTGLGDSRASSEKRGAKGRAGKDADSVDFVSQETPKRGSSIFRSGPPPKREGERSVQPKGELQRLQRVLAAAGFGSRRQCEELIMEGRVEVDGRPATQLGMQVDPKRAEIFVDGSPVRSQRHVYFVLNKPPGVVTTNRDPQGRTRVIDLIQERERVFPVGRLDRNSEGLLLLTNDGDLAQQLAHPRFGIQKVYRVTVAGKVDSDKLTQMREGIYIAEGRVAVDGAKILRHRAHSTDMEILLREGKNREIRRILARLGHKVLTLQRIAIGPLRLGELPRGAYRPVTHAELKRIREDIQRQSRRERESSEPGAEDERGTYKRSAPRDGGGIKRGGRPTGQRKPVGSQKAGQGKRPERSGAGRSEGTQQRSARAPRFGEGKQFGEGKRFDEGKKGREAFAKKRVKDLDSDFPFELSLEGSRSQGTVIGDPSPSAPESKPQRTKRASGGKVARGGKPKSGGRPGRGAKGSSGRSTTTSQGEASAPKKKFGQGRKKKRS